MNLSKVFPLDTLHSSRYFMTTPQVLYEFKRVLRIRAQLKMAAWAKQITLVSDNIYIILKSFGSSESFENLLKSKMI